MPRVNMWAAITKHRGCAFPCHGHPVLRHKPGPVRLEADDMPVYLQCSECGYTPLTPKQPELIKRFLEHWIKKNRPKRYLSMMKRLLCTLIGLMALTALGAAPAPPQLTGIVGTPTNGFWMTNRYFVFTNTAVRTPKLDLYEVTVYGTNTFKNATVLSWTPPTNTMALAGYKVYYGKTTGTGTNYYAVSTNITSVAFYSVLDTNQWWAYATSYDTNGLESVRSAQILFTPK